MGKAIVDGLLTLLIYFISMLILSGDILRSSYSKRQMYALVFIGVATLGLYFLRRRKSIRNIGYYVLIGFLMVFLLEFGGRRFYPLAKMGVVFITSFALVSYIEFKKNEKIKEEKYIETIRAKRNKDHKNDLG